MEETPEQIAEQKAWHKIIGKKIVCSKCDNRMSECFIFSVRTQLGRTREEHLLGVGPKSHVHVGCTACGHEGDYTPTDEEVYQYEFIARANIDLQILEKHGENPPITNVEVDSVFRPAGWKEDIDPDKIVEWRAKCHAIKVQ